MLANSLLFASASSLLLVACQSAPRPRNTEPAGGLDVEGVIQLAGAKPKWFNAVERERLVKLVKAQRCPCPGPVVSLDRCLVNGDAGGGRLKAACVRSRFAVRSVARGIKRGASDAQIRRWVRDRFGQKPAQFDLRSTACRGPADAPVTLMTFSDFQCPACAVGRQIGEVLVKHSGGKVRLCFKHFPLTTIHPDAMLAAQAAAAAHRQGKFWPMHDAMFGNQHALQAADLQRHAQAIGLDVTRFSADLESAAVKIAVLRDLAEADRLSLRGTPTFFINGRQMTDPMTIPDFLDWIAEGIAEAREAAQRPATQPTSAPASRPSSAESQPSVQ